VRFTNAVLSNWTVEELAAFRLKLLDNITQFEYTLPKYKTLTDIQAYAAVKERLSEARDYANYTVNQTSDSYRLAYAQERLYSAGSWSKFFGTGGYELTITDPQLKEFCIAKISEVEERLQYLEIYLPTAVRGSRQDLDLAYKELAAGNYGLCIFKASKSKADADVVLGLFGIEQSQLGSLLDKKLEIIRQSIVRASKKGYFPIVGYSYYDYAKSLKSSDKYSSLLYAEYALELSNLDMYIKKQSPPILQPVQPSTPALIALGFFAGVLVCSIVFGILFLRRGKRIKRSHKNLVLRNAIHQRKARSK
jgi:predicted S18 family serine protease